MKGEKDLGYEEHLNKTQKEPSKDELKDMEKAFCKTSLLKSDQQSLNNPYYHPDQGA